MCSRFCRAATLVVAAAAISTTAFAGFKSGQQVVIIDGSKFANADLGYVRNTGDSTQYIGCEVSGDVGYCTARNRDGLTRSCSTSVAKWVNTIRALNGDSYLYFKWDTNGNCVNISVENTSTTAPK